MSEPELVDILLVEDDPADLQLALRALQKSNLTKYVHVARDGAEALLFLLGERPGATRAFADVPKLVLLDLKLPKVHGLEVLQRLKSDARTKTIPVVVLTSSKEQADVAASYRLGANSYIVKPVNFDRYTVAVQELAMYWLSLNQPPEIKD